MSTHYTVSFYDENGEWQDGDGDYATKTEAIQRAEKWLRTNLTDTVRIVQCKEVLYVTITQPTIKVEKAK